MEFGPRALGNRSILGDPRSPTMQKALNLKVKYRESFRPFASSVLRERVADFFELDADSPYMLLVANVKPARCRKMSARALFGIDKLNVLRSDIPAVTHVDYSARIQTVHKETNPRYHALISRFEQTGCPVLVNTSFNVRGEPIVCTPEDAFSCFMGSEIEFLAVGNCIFAKKSKNQNLPATTRAPSRSTNGLWGAYCGAARNIPGICRPMKSLSMIARARFATGVGCPSPGMLIKAPWASSWASDASITVAPPSRSRAMMSLKCVPISESNRPVSNSRKNCCGPAGETEIENPLLAVEQIREKLRQCVGIVHAHAESIRIAEKDDRRTLLDGCGPPKEIGIDCVVGNIDHSASFRVPPFGIEAPRMFRSPADDGPAN
jgi:hypothetical protein